MSCVGKCAALAHDVAADCDYYDAISLCNGERAPRRHTQFAAVAGADESHKLTNKTNIKQPKT